MANINITTLDGIDSLRVNTVAQMTQVNQNHCGAYALVAAIGAFGRFPVQVGGLPIAYQNAGPFPVARNAVLMPTNTYAQLAALVYQVVGILNLLPNPLVFPVTPELGNGLNLYNSPAAIASVAMQIGAPLPQLTVRVDTSAAGLQLLQFYPNEVQRCQCAVGMANVNETGTAVYALPALNQTQIVCVQANHNLHWVVRGSNGQWYDPGTGLMNNQWNVDVVNNTIIAGMNVVYQFSGVWLTIQ
ncbi:hypothetical protein [Nostoc sp.]|uniref:hypothetical protein n=1 Tax=Nostoc sp. TaxID=1180 RepID=UPI002FF7ED9D